MLKGISLQLLMGPVVATAVARDVIEALTSAQVTVASGSRSGFQLTFAVSKRSRLLRELLPVGYFDPGIRVIVVAALNGRAEVLMDGLITRQQLAPSNDPGGSTLTVTGEDVSQAMDLIDFSNFPFPAMPAEARVALICAKYAMFGIVPRIVPSVLINVPNPLDVIPAQRGTDFAYVNQLAADVGYTFYIEPGPRAGMNLAYWGPEVKVGVPQAALSVNMDAQTNVETLTFTYDGTAKTLYVLYIQNLLTKAPIPIPIPDVTPLNPPLGAKPPLPRHIRLVTNEPDQRGASRYTPVQAAAIGLAKAARSADAISGSGTLDVLRYGRALKARQLVGVRGAGLAYDGLYYVKSVTHNIKPGEYKQNFSLTRNALIPTTGSVPV